MPVRTARTAPAEPAEIERTRKLLWRCSTKLIEAEMVGLDLDDLPDIMEVAKQAVEVEDWTQARNAAEKVAARLDELQRRQVVFVLEAAGEALGQLRRLGADGGFAGTLLGQAQRLLQAGDLDGALKHSVAANDDLRQRRNERLGTAFSELGQFIAARELSGEDMRGARSQLMVAEKAMMRGDTKSAIQGWLAVKANLDRGRVPATQESAS